MRLLDLFCKAGWFRRKEPEIYGWQIITRHNEALDKTVYRVFLPGGPIGLPPFWEDFDNYDDALTYYHEKAGWRDEKVEQP